MGFHVNVWVTGDLIERDRGAVRAKGTTLWSSYHRFLKETKRRKMTIDCLSANNRCETVRVWPTQTTRNPVILRSAPSNITLEVMLLLNITGVSEWWPAAATSCVAVSHTGDDIQNKYLSLSLTQFCPVWRWPFLTWATTPKNLHVIQERNRKYLRTTTAALWILQLFFLTWTTFCFREHVVTADRLPEGCRPLQEASHSYEMAQTTW